MSIRPADGMPRGGCCQGGSPIGPWTPAPMWRSFGSSRLGDEAPPSPPEGTEGEAEQGEAEQDQEQDQPEPDQPPPPHLTWWM
jgi:hypothetical protein